MGLDGIKKWFRRLTGAAEEEAKGGMPATTPAPGSNDDERETSTNAQTEGASDEPWPAKG